MKTPVQGRTISVIGSKLPMMISQDETRYSVVLNLFGVDRKDIFVDVNTRKHEFGVYAAKTTESSKSASFWIFGVPHDGSLQDMRVRYKGGGLQITVPRQILENIVA